MTNPLQFFRDDHKENRFDFESVNQKLIDLVNYNRILKQWATQSQRHNFKFDWRMHYFIKSIEEIEPSLPLIKNIEDE